MINATQVRTGNIIQIENVLYRVLKVTHITPGKGNAQIQCDVRNLKNNLKYNMRFRPGEGIEQVDLEQSTINFLYQDGGTYHFMDPTTYEQLELNKDFLEDALPYLKPELQLTLLRHDGQLVSFSLPKRVSLTVTECDPPSKGIAGAQKNATVETGAVFKVPMFIKVDDVISVDTETEEYLEKG